MSVCLCVYTDLSRVSWLVQSVRRLWELRVVPGRARMCLVFPPVCHQIRVSTQSLRHTSAVRRTLSTRHHACACFMLRWSITQSINRSVIYHLEKWSVVYNIKPKLKPNIKPNIMSQSVKNTSQWWKSRWYSNVFKFRLKDAVSDGCWSDGGRLFHAAGAAYENARCPDFGRVRGCS